MAFWSLDITVGEFFLDFSWMGLLLVLALWMRANIKLFQRYLIPANLIAGALGLMVGMNGFGLIDLTTDRLGAYVYHLLALLFIALGLRAPNKKVGLSSVKTGILFIIAYLVQGILGISIALILVYTIMPDLFVGIGFLPPLALGMNPGIAYTIGQSWEPFGFESGGVVGLTFSAAGFIAAYTTGIWAVRRGIKRGEAAYMMNEKEMPNYLKTGLLPRSDKQNPGRLTTASEAVETLTVHIGLIGFTYILTYGVMKFFEFGLLSVGAEAEVSTLWSFHFIFAAILALVTRRFMDRNNLAGFVDDVTMTRVSNFFMDFMIVASVAAISLVVVGQYWLPLLLISLAAIGATWWTMQRLCYNAFKNFKLERFTAIYGNMTGTLQSGLLLLRILDSGMKSPVSYNLVYGSGLALILGFPLLLLINAPVYYFSDVIQGFWMVLITMIGYLILLLVAWQYLKRNGKNVE